MCYDFYDPVFLNVSGTKIQMHRQNGPLGIPSPWDALGIFGDHLGPPGDPPGTPWGRPGDPQDPLGIPRDPPRIPSGSSEATKETQGLLHHVYFENGGCSEENPAMEELASSLRPRPYHALRSYICVYYI